MASKSSEQARAEAEAQKNQAEAEYKKAFFQKRVSLVKEGSKAASQNKYSEATGKFHTFIRTMEEYKGLKDGGLVPGSFDVKKEFADYVLVTEVYWELAKIYDRIKSTDSKGKVRGNSDLQKYVEKYVAFAKGVNFEKRFEKLCGERLRKYIQNDKPKNRDVFKGAYFKLTGSKCFIATALMDELSPQVFIGLRVFRDRKLKKSTLGKCFVGFYYFISPTLARLLLKAPRPVQSFVAKNIIERFYYTNLK